MAFGDALVPPEGVGTKKERQNSAKHQLEESAWGQSVGLAPSVGQGIRPEGGFDRGLIAGQIEIGILAQ